MTKKTPYIPAATDGDRDGLVQDGTEWERPVGTEVKFVVAADGDSYASIAAAWQPAGKTKHEYATHLFAINNGKLVIPGMIINL